MDAERVTHVLDCPRELFSGYTDWLRVFTAPAALGVREIDVLELHETVDGARTGARLWLVVKWVLSGEQTAALGLPAELVVIQVGRQRCGAEMPESHGLHCCRDRGHEMAFGHEYTIGGGYAPTRWWDSCEADLGQHTGPWKWVRGSEGVQRCSGCGQSFRKDGTAV